MNPLMYGQLIFDKEPKRCNVERIGSSLNGVGKTG